MDRKGLAILILAALILLIFVAPQRSLFGANSGQNAAMPSGYNLGNALFVGSSARASAQGSGESEGTAVLQGSGGVSSAPYDGGADFGGSSVSSASLIPRDVVATEDFGQFSPDKILGNQNYLDPRSQIGYPETVGGVLRNANRDFRSEPLNPAPQ
jgi:hypothetical protein